MDVDVDVDVDEEDDVKDDDDDQREGTDVDVDVDVDVEDGDDVGYDGRKSIYGRDGDVYGVEVSDDGRVVGSKDESSM